MSKLADSVRTEIERLLHEGLAIKSVSRQTGADAGTIRKIRLELGLPPWKRPRKEAVADEAPATKEEPADGEEAEDEDLSEALSEVSISVDAWGRPLEVTFGEENGFSVDARVLEVVAARVASIRAAAA